MDGNPSNKNGGGRKKRKLANLENEIHKRLVDQEEAVKIVAQHIKKGKGWTKRSEKAYRFFSISWSYRSWKNGTCKVFSRNLVWN